MKDVIRQRMFLGLAFVVSIFVGYMGQVDAKASISTSKKLDKATKLRANESYGKLPLYFIRNDGQMDKKVEFYEKGKGHNTYFTKDGVYLELRYSEQSTVDSKQKENKKSKIIKNTIRSSQIVNDKQETIDPAINQQLSKYEQAQPSTKSEMIKLVPLGANKDPRIIAEGIQKGKVNYFIGSDPKKWKTDIPTYQAVVYKEVYEGIDMKFYGNNRQMEYDVIVKPGVDPSIVQLSYEGIEGLSVTEEGNLEIALKQGNVIHKKPYCYQDIDGKRVEVAGNFKILNSELPNPKSQIVNPQFTYGFQVASYDKKHPLIIDPVLEYSTYLGGGYNDYGRKIAVDGSGNAYIMGYATSTDFPTRNPYQIPSKYWTYVFVTKLDPTGSALSYSTVLGGNTRSNHGMGIAVDDLENVYITGYTQSTDFPTQNPYQASNAGGASETFITKLDPSGSLLVYSTYLGGTSADIAHDIAVDSSGNAYITGATSSTDFPTKDPYQETFAGSHDVFLTKLDPSGSLLVYSTYLGGGSNEGGEGIAVDSLGNAYVTGWTYSTDFPLQNPYRWTFAGRSDGFVLKLDPSGSSLSYSTYLGGGGGVGIAVDNSGNAYITGGTGSSDFPIINPYQATLAGKNDAFVTKLDPTGSTIVYSTYLGGSSTEIGLDIAVDSSGNSFITGYTSSTDFPTKDPYQEIFAGGPRDAFVTKLDPTGSALSYSTYLGGSGFDFGLGIAVDGSGNAYVTGRTYSYDFPTQNSYQANLAGSIGDSDAFVAKLSDGSGTMNTPPIADAGTDQSVYVNGTVTLDGSNSWDSEGDPLTYNWTFTSLPAGSTATLTGSTTVSPSFTADVAGTYEASLTVNDGTADSATDTVSISTINVAPVANAGDNQSVIVGNLVFLDGTGSNDPDGDALTYNWTFTFIPSGSGSILYDDTSATPTFVPDTAGIYEVSLIVNDGTVDSAPDTITISVVTQQTAAITTAQETMDVINGLDEQFSEDVFNNPNNQNALTNKLNAVIVAIENGEYEDSLKKLKNDILKKTDGCAKTGEPDKNDWIKDCDAQAEVYPLVLEMIALLEQLI